MEPEGSLQHSQDLSTSTYPQPDQPSQHHPPPHLLSQGSFLILSIHLRLCLPSGLFSPIFPTNSLFASLFYPIRATFPAHFIRDLIILIILGEEYKYQWSSLSSSLHPPITSSLFGPNVLSTLFSNTLSLCSSLHVRDQVSYPYKTTSKIIVLCILIFERNAISL
jgi:hypothetical protein